MRSQRDLPKIFYTGRGLQGKVVQLAVEERSDIKELSEALAASLAAGRQLESQLAAAQALSTSLTYIPLFWFR